MPIYRYKCKRCGAEFRELVPRGDRAMVKCVACGSSEVTRMLSRFGVVYKGSGFYTTEYKRKSGGSGSSGEGGGKKSDNKG